MTSSVVTAEAESPATGPDERGNVDPPQWILGQSISLRRRAAGLSQREVAQRLGITRHTVSRWETGQCMPERKHLVGLALLFKVRPDQLFDRPKRPSG